MLSTAQGVADERRPGGAGDRLDGRCGLIAANRAEAAELGLDVGWRCAELDEMLRGSADADRPEDGR